MVPLGQKAGHLSSRIDLVSSLLREADLASFQPDDEADESPSVRREWHPPAGVGATYYLDSGNGPQTRRLDPARALTRWFLRGRTGWEELLLQLYYGHLSLAEVEAVASILWGKVEGSSVVREVVPGIVERIEKWLTLPLSNSYPYIFLHSVELRRRRSGEDPGLQIAAAVGINQFGYREPLGVVASTLGAEGLWNSLLAAMAARGVASPRLIVGEMADPAMRAAVEKRWDRSAFLIPELELEQEFLGRISPSDSQWMDQGLAELKACRNRAGGERIGAKLVDQLKKAGYGAVSVEFRQRLQCHLACLELPCAHWQRLCRANIIRAELNRLREQTRVLGPIHDDKAVVLLAAATFRRQCRISWNAKPFLAM